MRRLSQAQTSNLKLESFFNDDERLVHGADFSCANHARASQERELAQTSHAQISENATEARHLKRNILSEGTRADFSRVGSTG